MELTLAQLLYTWFSAWFSAWFIYHIWYIHMLLIRQYHIRWFRVRINKDILMGQFFKHLAQCLALFIFFTTMLAQSLKPSLHICSLNLMCFSLVASLMSPTPFLVTTNRMQQWFNVLTDIYNAFRLLFHCCILLEIKLTITPLLYIW